MKHDTGTAAARSTSATTFATGTATVQSAGAISTPRAREPKATAPVIPAAPKPTSLLTEAEAIINGHRASDYGKARENMERIAKLWSPILGKEVTPEQVILCMIQVKAARLCHTPEHRDSWLDIAGYAGVWDKMQRGE